MRNITNGRNVVNVEVLQGDCVELMRAMPENSVDSIVTDPPYGLEFMGKDWDSFKTGRSAKYANGGKLNEAKSITPKGGTNMPIGPSYVNRPAKRCADCGKQAWSGSPCKCDEPRWVLDNSPLHAFQAWFETVAVEALRVLKPGGHLLSFGGTRTYHRMACAIEDAGFEIRDSIHWVYGSGFPKSLNVGKAIDKAAGVEREVVGKGKGVVSNGGGRYNWHAEGTEGSGGDFDLTAPATDEAKRWDGWGTALKPAHEPIVVARKPLDGTVAGNVMEWGTGALNIDGCRVGTDGEDFSNVKGRPLMKINNRRTDGQSLSGPEQQEALRKLKVLGRWPANIVLDGAAAEALDEQSGVTKSGAAGKKGSSGFVNGYDGDYEVPYGDSGGASRFFTNADWSDDDWPFVYQAKPSKRERNAGLDQLPEHVACDMRAPRGRCDPCGRWADVGEGKNCRDCATAFERTSNAPKPQSNIHPTVKPVALMRHLVRLVTPPDGTVLDPFAGSGTTLVAAVLEGFNAIGCEMTDEYLPIIAGRVEWAKQQNAIRTEQPDLFTQGE